MAEDYPIRYYSELKQKFVVTFQFKYVCKYAAIFFKSIFEFFASSERNGTTIVIEMSKMTFLTAPIS